MSEDAVQGKRILIVGCGDVGLRLGGRLVATGARVTGLRRRPAPLPEGMETLAGDVTRPETLAPLAAHRFDAAVILLAPDESGDEAYRRTYVEGTRAVLAALAKGSPGLQAVLFASSTSVYHQGGGEWVDEGSPTLPTGFSGRRLLEAEALLAGLPCAASSVRFGGIYGPGRRRMIEQARAGRFTRAEPPHYTNRIHSEDCAGVLAHLLARAFRGEPLAAVYNATDTCAAPLAEVERWLAEQLGVPWQPGDLPPPARGGSKRVNSDRLRDSGYVFRYPDYRAGYGALLESP